MNQRRVILAVAVCLAIGAGARADAIKKTDGQVMGDVTETGALEVTVDVRGTATKIPVNEIDTIRFSDEPARLSTARTAIEAGRNEDAVTGLEGINQDEIKNRLIKQDVQFYIALAKARIALAGADRDAIVEAGRLMAAFVKDYPTSYHYLQANKLVGDMLVAAGKYSASQEYYGRVAEAPWPDFKMLAEVALGKALLAEGKTDEARKYFENVLAMDAPGESAARQRLAATLGKARCLAEAGESDEAIKLVQEVIDKGDPEQAELYAQAYNAQGLAYRKAGQVQDALLAYLHVDVLYFTSAKEHIEALENLIELWEEVQKPERADEATQILQERYHRSPRSQ